MESADAEPTDQRSTEEFGDRTKPVPGSSRPVVEAVPLADEPEPVATETPASTHDPVVADTPPESIHNVGTVVSQFDEGGVESTAQPVQEEQRTVDESQPPVSYGPNFATSVVAADDVNSDLFGPIRPEDGSDPLPFSLGRLIAERRDEQQDDADAPSGAAEDEQFQDFIDEDADNRSRSWFLRRDKS